MRKQWRQIWVGSAGGISEFVGEYKDKAMRFVGDPRSSTDSSTLQRLTFFHLGPDEVRQLAEKSTDSGKTWNPQYDFTYKRRPKKTPPSNSTPNKSFLHYDRVPTVFTRCAQFVQYVQQIEQNHVFLHVGYLHTIAHLITHKNTCADNLAQFGRLWQGPGCECSSRPFVHRIDAYSGVAIF